MHSTRPVRVATSQRPIKGLRWKLSRKNLRLVACAVPYTQSELRKMRKELLVNELRKYNLDTKGTKAQLIDRICTYVAKQDLSTPPPIPEKDPLSGRSEKVLMRKTNTWLSAACEQRGLSTEGKKIDLVLRIMDYIESKESGNKATLKKTVNEMQALVEERGMQLKEVSQQIVEKLQPGETVEGDLVTVVDNTTMEKINKMTKAEIRRKFIPFIPELGKKSMLKAEMINCIASAYEQLKPPVEEAETTGEKKVVDDETKGDAMAEILLWDQVKQDSGTFIGDVEESVDNLMYEMRTKYGKYIPVQIDSPMDYLSDEELKALEGLTETDQTLEGASGDISFEKELTESPVSDQDIDERDVLSSESEISTTEDPPFEDTVKGSRRRRESENAELEEEQVEALMEFERYLEENDVNFTTEAVTEADEFREEIEEVKEPVRKEQEEEKEFDDIFEEQETTLEQDDILEEQETTLEQDDILEEQETNLEQDTVLTKEEEPVVGELDVDLKTDQSELAEDSVASEIRETIAEDQDSNIKTEDNVAEQLESFPTEETAVPESEESSAEIEAEMKESTDAAYNTESTDTLEMVPLEEVPQDSMELTDSVGEETKAEEQEELKYELNMDSTVDQNTVATTSEMVLTYAESGGKSEDAVPKEIVQEVESTEDVSETKQEEEEIKTPIEVAEHILTMYAKEELLEMSNEEFLNIVKPLNMDVGPVRKDFLAKLAELTGKDLTVEEEPKYSLLELSLSTMEDNNPVLEAQQELIDDLDLPEGHPIEYEEEERDAVFSSVEEVEGTDSVLTIDSGSPPVLQSESLNGMESSSSITEEASSDTPSELTSVVSSVEEAVQPLSKVEQIEQINTTKIGKVLIEAQSQRAAWEKTSEAIQKILEEKYEAEKEPKIKVKLQQDLDSLTDHYEDLRTRVSLKEDEIKSLKSEINRIMLEYDLLPFDFMIGDGDGEFGPLITYSSLDHSFQMTSHSFDASLTDEFSQTQIEDSTVLNPSDPSILDQYNSNLEAASNSDLLLHKNSEISLKEAQPEQDQDLIKKHSSIAVTLVLGIKELWKQFFPPSSKKSENE